MTRTLKERRVKACAWEPYDALRGASPRLSMCLATSTIAGERQIQISAKSGLTRARAREILKNVERAVARWRKEGRALGMNKTDIEQFTDAFEHRERVIARRG